MGEMVREVDVRSRGDVERVSNGREVIHGDEGGRFSGGSDVTSLLYSR